MLNRFFPLTRSCRVALRGHRHSSRAKVYCFKKQQQQPQKTFRDSRCLRFCRYAPVNVDVWIYGSGAAKRFGKCAMVVVGSVGNLFPPLLLKPGYSNLQIKVNNPSYA